MACLGAVDRSRTKEGFVSGMENHKDLLIAVLLFLWECSNSGYKQEMRETSRAFSSLQGQRQTHAPWDRCGILKLTPGRKFRKFGFLQLLLLNRHQCVAAQEDVPGLGRVLSWLSWRSAWKHWEQEQDRQQSHSPQPAAFPVTFEVIRCPLSLCQSPRQSQHPLEKDVPRSL